MRLIIEYKIGEGYNVTQPVIYESVEKFLSDFEIACKNAYKENGYCTFQIGENSFYTGNFISEWMGDSYFTPKVYTVDEWFAKVEKCTQ